jgi:hypothetical protein
MISLLDSVFHFVATIESTAVNVKLFTIAPPTYSNRVWLSDKPQ